MQALDLSKMAEQLRSFKKILTKKYIKTGTTPVFTGELEKLRSHWDAFVEYKSSELGLQKVQKAKDNASKKVNHHTLGKGGYKLAIPKWEKMEQDLLDRGIQPVNMVLWSRGELGPIDWGLHLWAKDSASSPETRGGHTSSGRGNIPAG